MPVEIERPGGVVTLQLGYNNEENPFVAAKRFVGKSAIVPVCIERIRTE